MTPQPHRYSNNIYDKKIAVISIFPPPLGGVSLHTYRVCKKLASQNNTVYEWSAESWYRRFPFNSIYFFILISRIIMLKPDLIMYHATYIRSSITELHIISFLKKILGYSLTIIEHDCRHLSQRSQHEKDHYKKIVLAAENIILIGSLTYLSYAQCSLLIAKEISCEDAFLPPVSAEKTLSKKIYPNTLFQFFATHTPTLLINASHYAQNNGKDLYGVDVTIHLIANLIKTIPLLGLIIAITDTGTSKYALYIDSLIEKYALQKSVYLLAGGHLLWPLFSNIDIFLRPTLSDGASISIQEALLYNIPVIATNVCKRPDTVITYDAHDYQSYSATVARCINQRIQDGKINPRPYHLHAQ